MVGVGTPTQLTAATFGALATGTQTFSSAASQTTVSSNAALPEGAEADPIANSTYCGQTALSDPNQAIYSFPIASATTLAGGPTVTADVTLPPTAVSAELAARLWDIAPGGTQTMVERAVYRFDSGAQPPTSPQHISFELWPNVYTVAAGHTLQLELTQDDSPTWRPDNVASSLMIANLQLTIPVH